MERVLLIGGAGYIGGLSADKLIKNGFDVTVYDNLLYEDRYLKDVKFIYGDIRETNKIVEISNDFDIIILMAALVGDPACSTDPQLAEEINYTAIKNLAYSIPLDKHVIFMSTASVYGAQNTLLDELSCTNPLSVYASTKLRSEAHITQRNGTIFRLGTVYGLGDTYSRIRMDLVVNVLTMKALKYGGISINGGEQWRPIISVEDISEYIVEASKRKLAGTYILSYKNVMIRELGEELANIIPNTKINYTDISFQDARNYKVDNSKSLSIFDYKPKVSVETEVKRMMKMFIEQRIKNPEDIIYNNGAYLKELKWNGK
jgi:nucleoside-diphosphate-sugar epimerase